jgi:hypothetical protein
MAITSPADSSASRSPRLISLAPSIAKSVRLRLASARLVCGLG